MIDIHDYLRQLFNDCIPQPYQTPSGWIAENIRFSRPEDPVQGLIDLKLSPFLIEPMDAWEVEEGQGLKEITVVAPEQTGKTMYWLSSLVRSFEFMPGVGLVYYTSDEKAEKINSLKFEPMLSNIPKYAELLKRPFAHTKDSYSLGNNTLFFGGIGSRVSSYTAAKLIADEIDDWKEPKNIDSIHDIRKRARAYREAVFCKVCTPKGTEKESRIWREFKLSSMGEYYLRCQKCYKLSIRSADIYRMQWELDDNDHIIPESIRLKCPLCGHEHVEADKVQMVRGGGYIHKYPERIKTNVGFQWGAMASLMPSLCWLNLAQAQRFAGRSGRIQDQIFFDNSMRGRPYHAREVETSATRALKLHFAPMPEADKIVFRFLSVDTQDDGFFWIVRGIDLNENSYLLGHGKANTTTELATIWKAKYAGKPCLMGIIDEGGHRAGEVRDWADEMKGGIFTYKGDPRTQKNYKHSENIRNLLLANEKFYRRNLLYTIYAPSANRTRHYWFLPEDVSSQYREQVTAYHANSAVRDGNELENYVSDGNDHYFDCEKMNLVIQEMFIREIAPKLLKSSTKK